MALAETLKPLARVAAAKFPRSLSPARFRRTCRSVLWQTIVLFLVLGCLAYLGHNVVLNLRARGLASGFDFLSKEAGFGIGFSLIPFTEVDSYGRAFLVGLLNTMLVAIVSIALATVLGVIVGIARVAKHPPTAGAALGYVEGLRNIPLLLQVLFWHQLLINALPSVRQSFNIGGWIFINNRGLVVPGIAAVLAPPVLLYSAVAAIAVALAIAVLRPAEPSPARTFAIRGLAALLVVAIMATLAGITWQRPVLAGFNFKGGLVLVPEFVALVVALTIYNAAFIAEIVRAGIESVGKGQRDAAAALGLSSGLTMRLVILPLAMRVVIPPLANQYSHLIKASSLAAIIGYPDLVNVFLGTALNQTGRAIEIIAMTMAVYLALSAVVAAFTAWFNGRFSLVER